MSKNIKLEPIDFGTAGIRGIVGKGINHLSQAHVQRITHGFAKYLLNKYKDEKQIKVVIGRDSRRYSHKYASIIANILQSYKKFKIIISKDLTPTPFVSFLIIKHQAHGGFNITASHNPYLYNGIKLYNNYGSQCLPEEIEQIKSYFENYDFYSEYVDAKFPLSSKNIQINTEKEKKEYLTKAIQAGGEYNFGTSKKIKFVYSSLHGAGIKFAREIFDRFGFKQNIDYFMPTEQIKPNRNFPTCPYPNPELNEAYKESEIVALKNNADAIIVTDPDVDRVGIKVLHKGQYVLLNGNETATLIFDFLLKNIENIKQNSYIVYSFVSSNLPALIAKKHNINSFIVPTGFKWISKFINENSGNYLYGFEESYGSLIDPSIARDKDALQSLAILLKMVDFYKQQSKTLVDVLNDIYEEYNFISSKTINIEISENFDLSKLQQQFKNIDLANKVVTDFNENTDYMKANMIKISFKDNDDWIALRPSGTEPKIKFYIFAYGKTKKISEENLNKYIEKIELLVR
ncbi:phospho-sugar mutase [Mycoplasma sp. HS2188]|uniref:phospho-sugar mutase n=1 Tax=Mycoplasma sp. HS2188 TaxID=2976765 RepID=UPI0021AA750D|nr:phospho-sugar mutase [Mycoplasma sp. HS2188]MCT4469698.1 phospho-sugar mutase [Mycoplasma sp. HS2188]